jgi:PAS domain-containing protein
VSAPPREIRLLVGALISFLVVLVVALFALTVSILRLNRRASTADSIVSAIKPAMNTASAEDLTSRLQVLATAGGVNRIEVYRGTQLFAAAGTALPSAEVLTRQTGGGRVLIYFEVWSWAGGRRTALVTAAYVLIAAMAGVLIFILYVRQFLRPVEEMLDHARQLSENPRGDHDARYLVHTFREAVERIQQQSQEIDDLRDAASSRTPDVLELARALNTSFKSGFLALDASGSVIAVNDAGREILNVPDGPVHSLAMLPESFSAPVRSSIEEKTALTRREVLLDSGTLIGLTTVPLFDEGTFVGLFALFTDLTTYRAMEGRLRDLEALVGLGQMAAGIAHEFRNSLFTILGYLKLAQRNGSAEQNVKIVSAETEARKLAGAVDALLTFTKPLQLHSRRFRHQTAATSLAAIQAR